MENQIGKWRNFSRWNNMLLCVLNLCCVITWRWLRLSELNRFRFDGLLTEWWGLLSIELRNYFMTIFLFCAMCSLGVREINSFCSDRDAIRNRNNYRLINEISVLCVLCWLISQAAHFRCCCIGIWMISFAGRGLSIVKPYTFKALSATGLQLCKLPRVIAVMAWHYANFWLFY